MHMHTARWMLPTSWVWKSALKHCFTNTKPLTEMKHGYLATHLSLGHPCCSLPWPHGGGGNRKLPGKIGMAWHAPIRQCLINCLSLLRYINIQCLFMCILRWAPGPEILPPNHLHCIFQKCMEQKKLPAIQRINISKGAHDDCNTCSSTAWLLDAAKKQGHTQFCNKTSLTRTYSFNTCWLLAVKHPITQQIYSIKIVKVPCPTELMYSWYY